MMQYDQYQNDYVAFINGLFDKGYAEKVHKESVEADPARCGTFPIMARIIPRSLRRSELCLSAVLSSLEPILSTTPRANSNKLVSHVLTRFQQEESVPYMGNIEAMFYQF